LKIAFISFEYLPDTGSGGIATYVWNASRMLVRAGHHVEVACGSPTWSGSELDDGVVVHRILTDPKRRAAFGPLAVDALGLRHSAIGGFDVIESPDFGADGAEFAQAHPDVALVVKLHTPSYLVRKLNKSRFNILGATRFGLGALRRGQWPKWAVQPDTRHEDFERSVARVADCVAAPSHAIAQVVGNEWQLPKARISVFPLPFEIPSELAEMSLPGTGSGPNLLFIGRLEPRKGVQHLGHAFAIVKRRFPKASLRCIGEVLPSPIVGISMRDYIRKHAATYSSAIEFPGPVPREKLAKELACADVCVFPSLWESFGYVCLEAMSAARAIVASSAGGMAEVLADGAGVLVEPGSPRRWADALCTVLADGEKRRKLGEVARMRVQSKYCYAKILPQQLACYQQAYEMRSAIGPRSPTEIPKRPI
jgi:glycosyltransferase involved in cell wall biosynthesis